MRWARSTVHQPTDHSPAVVVPGPGQFDPLAPENPTPAMQLIQALPTVEVVEWAGTSGESGEEATVRVREGVSKTIASVHWD